MFRPIRLIVLLTVAFVSGIFWERLNMGERCAELGGDPRGGLCMESAK